LEPSGIFRSTLKPGVVLNLEEAKANAKAREAINLPSQCPVLLDIRHIKQVTFKALMFSAAAGDPDNFTAAAMLVSSIQSKVVAGLAKRSKKSQIPTKVFTDEASAIAWLSEFLPA
ncbi:MAG: hypothetical protein AAGB22_01980, partial [Bacteroidota bacterium]